MATTVDQVATDALGLPVRSRVLLVEKLLASLSGEVDPSVERANLNEVRRRREDMRAGRTKLLEGDEVMRQVRSALGQ
jgi:putative addiction module component (TIGR02574 family)